RAGPAGRSAYELGAPLAAGERLFVSARYDTRGRRGPSSRSVTLALADGGHFALTLAADIEPWLAVEPNELPFLRVLEGQGAECAFEVRSVSGEPFALEATHLAMPAWVTLELTPEGPDGSGRARAWRAHGTLGKEAPRGTFAYPLEVASDVVIPGTGADTVTGGAERRFSAAPAWRLQGVGPVALSSPNPELGLARA